MMELTEENYKILSVEHLGIVAGTLKEISLSSRVDKLLGDKKSSQKVSMGQRVCAMVINGLGFASRALSMTPHFFSGRPIEEFLGEGVKADYLNDDALGRALDCIYDYGVTQFFSSLALDIGIEQGIIGSSARLDSTTFSFTGKYDGFESLETDAEQINITYGFSKDLRPDLKQATLSIATTGEGSFPFWCEPQDGNSSDKASFHKTIAAYNKFKEQIKSAPDFMWVADSALYNSEKLLVSSGQNFFWITRVPETINEAKSIVEKKSSELQFESIGNGYSMCSLFSKYGGVDQRWLLIFSEQAALREIETFEKYLEKEKEKQEKIFWHLSHKVFSCEKDAIKAFEDLVKPCKFFKASYKIEEVKKHKKKGRPKKSDAGEVSGYCIIATLEPDNEKIEEKKSTKGRFILATNQLDFEKLTDLQVFQEYKALQNTERGFRFLKDPWFLTKEFFLKTPSRIAALMAIMTLSLLVYSVAEKKIRNALKEKEETIPNQNKKPVQNPTLRWIFQLFIGVSKLAIRTEKVFDKFLIKLNNVQKKILQLFGGEIENFYLSTA